MCGICGIVDFATPPTADTLRAMKQAIRHRGPDDSGLEMLGPAALGHRRLSIIDLSPTGHQPMCSHDGQAWIAYNGEVYNFPELRARLESMGVSFRGTSDTEVVLEGYRRWGTDVFAMLNGMFAIAIWDVPTQTLHLARDRFGIKPLYYHATKSGLVFGSEIKAILASGCIERRMSWAGLHEHLYYGNCLRDGTLFEGISRLLPAHYMSVSPNGRTIKPYWDAGQVVQLRDSVETATERVRDHLEAAVRRHLISDVPVGVFLSGGIDSSAITAFASRHYQGRLRTFSVGFDFDRGVNELPKARRVAEHFGTQHEELHIAGRNMPDIIERLVRAHDEPFSDAANIPLYLLCEGIRDEIKVILQGDGGDEIFAGYRRYNVLAHERFWRVVAWAAPKLASIVPRRPEFYRGMRFFQAMGQRDPAMRMALLMTQEFYGSPPTRVFTADARNRLSESDPFRQYRVQFERFRKLDPVQRMLYVDSQILLPDQFLEKVDKSTMACSIEIRVPFLDAVLSEYAMGLPASLKIRHAQKKWILRRALRGVLPDDILDGPKTGFGVPFEYWLKEPLADYMRGVLLDPGVLSQGLFDRSALEACIAEHIAGRRNNGFLLYKLLNLVLWQRFYLNGESR